MPSSPLLAVDTSAGTCVAVVVDGAVVATRERRDARGHAEHLTPLIEAALAEVGFVPRDLAAVAVGTGPAPFTGLRVGLVTAQLLARGLGIPVWGVPSLDAWAGSALAAAPEVASVRVVTDARRKEVYTARYRRVPSSPAGFVREGDFAVGRAADVAGPDDLPEGTVLVGPGLAIYAEWAQESGAQQLEAELDVARIALIGAARAAAGEPTPLEPLYLRRPDVHGVAGSRL